MNDEFILIEEYCRYTLVERSFLQSLQELGLIEIIQQGEAYYLDPEQITTIEKYSEWHYDLDINAEGIDAMQALLLRIERMHQEIRNLKSRLTLFE